jgi:hypothetical protein
VLDSIVKVFTVHSRPNHFLPWQVCAVCVCVCVRVCACVSCVWRMSCQLAF